MTNIEIGASHDGFWRPEVDDGVAVFHRKEDTKPTLKHLAFNRPSGLTAPEANDLLGRHLMARRGDNADEIFGVYYSTEVVSYILYQ